MTDLEILQKEALDQFLRRQKYSRQIAKIDNSGLHCGSPMYFYCNHCGIPTEVLTEDYLFAPIQSCSQCQGIEKQGWLAKFKEIKND